jgi:protocatechuate 3,4-dioxygenase beta subunit
MRCSYRWIPIAGVLALTASGAGAQETRQIIMEAREGMQIVAPGGMNPRQFKTGTGRIRGRVIAADSGAPLRRVQVRLMGPEVAPKAMITDADGRYEFRDLPAGRFSIAAMKSGYVNVQYGQTRPFEPGKSIELADAQVIEKADIVLPRGSVIAGRIVDEFGEPVTDAMVSAMRSVWSGGRRRLQPSGRMSQTNDLGQFRIFGLPPGDYYVSAQFRSGETMVLDMVSASMVGAAASNAPASGYASTYYPGTTSPADAQKIALAVGQEMQGADFALTPVRLVKIAGSVVRSDGRPMEGAMVNLMPRNLEGGFFMMERTGRTDKNGAFTIGGVAPGDYNLQVRGLQISMSGGGDNAMFTTRMAAIAGEEPEVGVAPVIAGGEDVANVVIVTSKGGTAAGRVTFEGGAQPQSLSGIRMTTTPTENEGPTMVFPAGPNAQPPGAVQPDGSFELRGLSGNRLVRATGLPQGWVLKSVRVDGQDVTDAGFDFKPGSAVTGLEVVVTNRSTDLSGTVVSSNGPVKDYTVVVFADEPAKWALPSSRYVTATRGDQDGRFKIRNLPPGEYYAAAVEYLAQGEWGDPEVLERLRAKASRITLTDGAPKTVELRIQ